MIEAIKLNDIPGRNIRYLDIVKDIEEFLASNNDAVEIKFPPERRATSVYSVYYTQIKRCNYQVRCIQRNGRVFLIRKDVEL